ncbi:MAG: molybdenum cofactor biosynthesis protein MoaE [Candidatus Neomarinimicrobiota bacterium]
MIIAEIAEGPITNFPENDSRRNQGAELVFKGRVRSRENGKLIKALDYEQYPAMALTELENLAQKTVRKFPISDLFCRHRVGEVPIGAASLQVVIWSEHRREGFDAMAFFIAELKQRVPIWKWAVFPDGSRIPSESKHC